jgi:hypothetical protein
VVLQLEPRRPGLVVLPPSRLERAVPKLARVPRLVVLVVLLDL